MSFDLTEAEFQPLAGLPIEQVVDLAAELDVLAPADIDRRELLVECVLALVEHGRREGLPFSKYDREDLEALSREDLTSIGRIQGLTGSVSLRAVLSRGAAVYKTYQNKRIDHPIPLMLPMLLSAVARAGRSG